MARLVNRLTPARIRHLSAEGFYSDGNGLYLQIRKGGRSWVFRYKMHGRKTPRDLGLGPLGSVPLALAREKAEAARKLIAAGKDPIQAKAEARADAIMDAAKGLTFQFCAQKYIEAHKPSWKNPKHAAQWDSTLASYVYPLIGSLAASEVDVAAVLSVLEQKCDDLHGKPSLWIAKNETASRVRGRIEVILDWARIRGYRTGENPARWKGNLEHMLPARSKVHKVRHHPALPYVQLPAFLTDLRDREGVAARALEALILTASRTNEIVGARVGEVDLDQKLWIIPAERMKAGREHRVPLSDAALRVFTEAIEGRDGAADDLVFPNESGAALSENGMLSLLARMGRTDITCHGFRSTFRDWCAERTSYSSEVAEMALAHTISDKVEAAYRRGDLFEKRRRLMDDWAKFCALPVSAAAVIPINDAKRRSAPAGRR